MSTDALHLLAAFDALDPADKQKVAVEILRRSAGGDSLPNDTFNDLAAELFESYDAEETNGSDR